MPYFQKNKNLEVFVETFSEFVESQNFRVNEISLIGFQGQSMDDEKQLFKQLNDQLDEIIAKKK